MQSERWQRCTEVFGAAIEQPRNGRAAFLEQRCNGDLALRRGVELLLKYHDQSGAFIETPAFEVAPELLVGDPGALIGRRLGTYRMDAILGSGGMGVVYLASDERLERKVALKLLPPSVVANEAQLHLLEREARTASALNHPNIVTIHEIGEVDSTHFIATEFIEGNTLRERISKGPIPPEEALDIIIQIASALGVAHRAGIVHRDIKPENIMLRPDGYVKVLDFGIAKLLQPEGATSGGRMTQQRVIVGTTRYMSPEQTKGETVDARSDLWSVGAVLYEMLAGSPPFDGKTPTDVIAAILLDDPEPLHRGGRNVAPPLHKVAERSLRKCPVERYATAEEMLSDLRAIKEKSRPIALASNRVRWIGVAVVAILLISLGLFYGWRERNVPRRDAPAAVVEKGIAVLPFENLSAEKDDAFFADGMQNDVLTSVGKIKNLKVIARGSVMDYRGARLAGKVREIGGALGVSHVLEGSVRRSADRVVVNVALIDTRDERQVWSERYERTLTDTISLQGELALEIARALNATLTPAEATVAAAKPTQNAEAYLLYLRAREVEIAHTDRFSDELQPAIQLYQQAVDLDPRFALARARLSLCASRFFNNTGFPDWKAKARSEAEEALRISPDLGEARLALTHCYLWGDGDYDRALAELGRTAELLPNSAEVPLTAAFIYKRQNRYRDRLAALNRAEALDPRNKKVVGFLSMTLRFLRNWPEAIAALDRLAALTPEGSSDFRWIRVANKFRLTGDIDLLKKWIVEETDAGRDADHDLIDQVHFETAMLERDYTQAARLLSAIPPWVLSEGELASGAHSKAFHEALLAIAREDEPSVKQRALEIARAEIQSRLVVPGSVRPDNERAHADLALIDAFLGNKEEAIREALYAIELVPQGMMIERNNFSSALAMVYAQIGETDKAIDLVEHLLTRPADLDCGTGLVYNMTLTDLKWRWQWDPLRSHPRFQKILAGPEPKTIY